MEEHRRIGLYIPESLYQRLRRASYVTGQSQSKLLRIALTKHMIAVEHLDNIIPEERKALQGMVERRDSDE